MGFPLVLAGGVAGAYANIRHLSAWGVVLPSVSRMGFLGSYGVLCSRVASRVYANIRDRYLSDLVYFFFCRPHRGWVMWGHLCSRVALAYADIRWWHLSAWDLYILRVSAEECSSIIRLFRFEILVRHLGAGGVGAVMFHPGVSKVASQCHVGWVSVVDPLGVCVVSRG